MNETHTRGETHGCIVCGRLYELYVVYDADGRFRDCKVMSAGAKVVPYPSRALVACDRHTDDEIRRAVARAYGESADSDD